MDSMTETKPIQALTPEQAAAITAAFATLAVEAEKALQQFGAGLHAMAKEAARVRDRQKQSITGSS